jgi:hypothetical protein
MKHGGGPAKKFGGISGNDPDWFALSVCGYQNGVKVADSVLFYLADFRFASSAQDYIVKTWQWVDLKILGKVDSLTFNMFSSDTGAFGINNPTYFCMDNLITNYDISVGVKENTVQRFSVFPNPAEDWISIMPFHEITRLRLFDLQGKELSISNKETVMDIRSLAKGVYLLQIEQDNSVFYSKFVKK